jgi:hypothetical protein
VEKKKYFKNNALSDWTWDKHLTLDIEYIGKYYRQLMAVDGKPLPQFYDETQIKMAPRQFPTSNVKTETILD